MATPRPAKIKEEEIPLDIVQGVLPDSKNEYYFALALDKAQIEYLFQVPLGMTGIRGSQVIDFVVFNPVPVACFIQGAYWHGKRSETEDQLKHAAAEKRYGRGNVIDFSEEETSSIEAASKAIREKL